MHNWKEFSGFPFGTFSKDSERKWKYGSMKANPIFWGWGASAGEWSSNIPFMRSSQVYSMESVNVPEIVAIPLEFSPTWGWEFKKDLNDWRSSSEGCRNRDASCGVAISSIYQCQYSLKISRLTFFKSRYSPDVSLRDFWTLELQARKKSNMAHKTWVLPLPFSPQTRNGDKSDPKSIFKWWNLLKLVRLKDRRSGVVSWLVDSELLVVIFVDCVFAEPNVRLNFSCTGVLSGQKQSADSQTTLAEMWTCTVVDE